MRKLYFILVIQCCWVMGIAQNTLSGKVLEAGTAKPVAAATIFVSNSSLGTSSNEAGAFILKKPAGEKFRLVVSCIGYETFAKDFQSGTSDKNMVIELRRKAADLEEVVVTPADRNGWLNYGDIFTEYFIGNSSYARTCKIKNPKAIKFRMREKDSLLTVTADEPIVIENKSLGYIIRYELKDFKYYFSNNTVYYSGYALFEDLAAKEGQAGGKYLAARQKVYAVSLMHFIRSLYSNRTKEDGFIIMRRVKNGAVEMKKASALQEKEYDGVESFDTIYEISKNNTQVKITATEMAANQSTLPSTDKSSINNILSYENGSVLLNFPDSLQVIYTKSSPPFEFSKYATDNRSAKVIVSELSLIRPGPVTIMRNGSFEPTNLAMNGFWGWWEKISIMLPYDYQPIE